MSEVFSPTVLVCSLNRASYLRLIRTGQTIAKNQKLSLSLLSIQPQELVTANTAESIQVFYNIATDMGVPIQVLFSNTPILTLAVYAKKIGATHLLVDETDIPEQMLFSSLRQLLPDVTLSIIKESGERVTIPPTPIAKTHVIN